MTRSLYRIYLAPDPQGSLQQTPRKTRDFYDIDLKQFQISPKTRWYRIVQTSPGRVFTTLWKAGGQGKTDNVTIAALGSFMRLSSDLWYVDGRDVFIEAARDLQQSAMTRPRAIALLLALIVFLYLIVEGLFAHWNSQPLPAIQPLARFTALAMLLLLGLEQLINGLKRLRQHSQLER